VPRVWTEILYQSFWNDIKNVTTTANFTPAGIQPRNNYATLAGLDHRDKVLSSGEDTAPQDEKQKGSTMNRINRHTIIAGALLISFLGGASLQGQQLTTNNNGNEDAFDRSIAASYTRTRWFPDVLGPYINPRVPPFHFANSELLHELIQNGQLRLSLQDAIALAIENNLDIAVARYNPEYAQIDKVRTASGAADRGVEGTFQSSALFSGALGGGISSSSAGAASSGAGTATGDETGITNIGPVGSFDPEVGFVTGIGYHVTPLSTGILYGTPIQTLNTTEYEGFFGQEFPTGTSYAISVYGARQSANGDTLLFNPQVNGALLIGINQHLLNGFGYRANAKFIRIAANDVGIAKDYFREQVANTVQQIENDYWTLVEDKQNVLVAQEAVNYNQKLLQDNRRQVQIGTLAPLDVIQAESNLATAQQNLIVAQTSYQQQQELMKTVLSKQVTGDLLTASVDPTDPLPNPQAADVPAVEQALEIAHGNRPEVELNNLNLKNEEVILKANRNSLLPTLDAFVSYQPSGLAGIEVLRAESLSGLGGIGKPIGTITSGTGQLLNQLFDNKFPSYAVGLSLSMPIRNRAAQADAARALLEEHQLRTTVQQTLNTIDQDVRQAEIAVVQGRARIEAATKAVSYAQQQLMDEEKKFKVGESTVTLVIQMQNALTQAEGTLVTAQASYATALTQFEQATGTILAKNNVQLVDALTGHVHRMPNIPGTPAAQSGNIPGAAPVQVSGK
jgi:outer membrane protein